MRCPDCNKFRSTDTQTPDVESIDIDTDDGTITASVRLVLTCCECCTEMKEGNLEVEGEVPPEAWRNIIKAHSPGPAHALSVKETDVEANKTAGKKPGVEVVVEYEIRCGCQSRQNEPLYAGRADAHIPSADMDELT